MQQLRRGILNGELWALKVLDSSGSKPPAFMLGDNLWLGSSALCEAAHSGLHLPISPFVEHKMNLSLLTEKPPYAVRYRVAYLEHNSPYQVDVVFAQVQPVIHLGLCVPLECSSEDLVRLLSVYLKSELFLSNDLHGLKPRVLRVKELGFKAFAYYDLLSFRLLAIFVVYTLLMSSCAYCLRYRQQSSNSGGTSVASRNQRNQQTNEEPTKLVEFILCYDLQLNCSTIFAWSDTSSKTFAFLNGGRVVSAFIATFFHTFILLNAIVSNPVQVFMYASNIGNMDVAMDVFFLISGFLQVFTFLQNRNRVDKIRKSSFIQSVLEVPRTLIHRYLRLAPLYYFMICVSHLTLHYLDNTTVFHTAGVLAEKSILTTLLVIYAKKPKFAKMSLLLLLTSSVAYQTLVALQLNFQISLETTFTHFTQLYMHPLVRIFPYLSGALTCWLYVEYKSELLSHKLLNNFFSHLILLLFAICTQAAPLGRGYSVRVESFIFALQRCCYTWSGCWTVLALANNHLSWYRRLLSLQVFQSAIHMSYALSLLNSLLIVCVFSVGNKVVFVEPIRMILLFIGLVVVLYLLCFPLTLLFEMPYRNISNLLNKRKVEKSA
ncbi:unnamed protein product [Ceratitis capitata]|uniref:(Mediterranean fruit fly) hypothetical protein n=1 Tax=Ceratitis capitata TaxID=7213 RepID=A0A811U1A7_CERCA|nr:unnamed protein product [Ceratitis capitata]